MSSEATIILFDVGSSSPTFFEQAKDCLEKKIVNELVLKPKNEVSLILYGSRTTNNNLNKTRGGYENINIVESMKPVNWNVLRYIKRKMESPNEHAVADWLEALMVSISYFKDLKLKKLSKKIVLFTTLNAEVDNRDISGTVEGLLQFMEIKLIVITTNVIHGNVSRFDETIAKSQIRAEGEELILQLVKCTNGKLYNLNEAVSELVYAEKNPAKRIASNYDLSIGSKLIIKVAVCIYVQDQQILNPYKTRVLKALAIDAGRSHVESDSVIVNVTVKVKDEPTEPSIVEEEVDLGIKTEAPSESIRIEFDEETPANGGNVEPMAIEHPPLNIEAEIQEMDTSTGVERSSSTEDQIPLFAGNDTQGGELNVKIITQPCFPKIDLYHGKDLIPPDRVESLVTKGYKYDGEFYEFQEPPYHNGGKGLRCLGFTKTDTIRSEYLQCDTIRLVVPQKRFSVKRFSALIKAMQRQDLTLVARFTFNDRTVPEMVALFPSQDYLLMYKLYFGSQMFSSRSQKLPRLRKNDRFTPSSEQYDFMDKFIDSMDLMGDSQTPEFFKYLQDPGFQHQCNSFAYALLNLDQDLAEQGEDVLALITPPKQLSSDDLEEMKALFPLEEKK